MHKAGMRVLQAFMKHLCILSAGPVHCQSPALQSFVSFV